MQQTQKYKLNLIETSDVFSPQPLNENAQKTEAALADGLATVRAEAAAGDAALNQKIVNLENKRIVVGTYVGNHENRGDIQKISLGFTPILVLLLYDNGVYAVWKDHPLLDTGFVGMELVEGGFTVRYILNLYINDKGKVYGYIAFS